MTAYREVRKHGRAAVTAYYRVHADLIVAEKNNGGEMVELIKQVFRVGLLFGHEARADQ